MKSNLAADQWRQLRRSVGRHRRLVAAGFGAAAVALTVTALQPSPPQTTPVLAAARDLGGGSPLRQEDVTTVRLPSGLVPAGSLRPSADVDGVLLAAPMRRGEPLTDARILGPGLLREVRDDAGVGTDVVAAPVRLADADTARLVQVGDRVDVLAADARPDGGDRDRARIVAGGVRVLAVPRAGDDHGFAPAQVSEGALVVLATTPDVAAGLARAAVTARISVAIRDG